MHRPQRRVRRNREQAPDPRTQEARAVMLKNIEVGPELIAALVAHGWLFSEQKHDAVAVSDAVGAVLHRSLSAGVTPGEKPLLQIDLEVLQAAWPWAKPNSQPTAQNAAKALGTAIKCAAQAGFTPEAYAQHARQKWGLEL